MNKLFVGLLVIAAGAGVFFLLRKKKDTPSQPGVKKEDIIGKWKTDPARTSNDSAAIAYCYDFRDDGVVLKSLVDSAIADTSHYSLNNQHELVWKEKATDSTGTLFSVLLLGKDSLELQSKDSSKLLLIKVK